MPRDPQKISPDERAAQLRQRYHAILQPIAYMMLVFYLNWPGYYDLNIGGGSRPDRLRIIGHKFGMFQIKECDG